MKKSALLISILLAIAILLTACNKEPDILCGNCGTTVPGDSFFCPNCGTAFLQNSADATTGTTAATTETTVATTESTATQSENSPVTQTPAVSTHTHSFSAATCLHPQICACGATSGGLAGHEYQNYVCIHCDAVDTDHAYEYLCLWIYAFGDRQGDLYRIDMRDGADMYSLVYDVKKGYAYASISTAYGEDFLFTCLWLDNCGYGTSGHNCTLEGTLNPSNFTETSALPVSSFTGNENLRDSFVEFTQVSICMVLDWLDSYLYNNDAGITIADLGFTAY